MDTKPIPIGQFKQQCLAIVERVARTRRPVVISKRGKPVARLVPLETERETEEAVLRELRQGDGRMLVDEARFLAPTSEIAKWRTE